jgi:lipoprotein-anchoring transpeptidase ErfK/SrfK
MIQIKQITFRIGLVLAVAGMASSCRQLPPLPLVESPRVRLDQPPAGPVLYEWTGAELTGPVTVTIDLSEQKARISRGGQPAGWTYVASGTSSHPTPVGSFSIKEKARYKRSTSWGVVVDASGDTVNRNARNGRSAVPSGGHFVGASMPFWMRINGAIGMHAGPIPHPGSPASHGCIRLPRGMAEILFEATQLGAPVEVVP